MMCGAPALAGGARKREFAFADGAVELVEMRHRARLARRQRTTSSKPIRASDLARRMAELQALREMVRKAEARREGPPINLEHQFYFGQSRTVTQSNGPKKRYAM